MPDHDGPSRRAVLRGALATGVAAPIVAACSTTTPTSKASGGGSSSGRGGSHGTHPAAVAKTTQVPQGGGLVDANAGVVVTQPKRGEFKGFSSVCTHAGCPLTNVSHGTINCDCHGSEFSIKDGSVVRGPATLTLPGRKISVQGSEIYLA